MKHAIASLRFSLSEGASYYQQLMTQIQQGITDGALEVGDQLPSSRALATTLGVSRSTTSKAYDHLIAEGILVSEEKRGVFVAAQPLALGRPKHEVLPYPQPSAPPLVVFDSGVDVTVFPTKEWAASQRRSWLNPDPLVLQGRYPTGYPALKEAIADYLYRVRGMVCQPEQIIVTAGSRDSVILLQHAISELVKPSSGAKEKAVWWLEDPSYVPTREVISQYCETALLPVDEAGATLIPSDSANNVALLTPNRQYPLGVAMSSLRRQEWLQRLESSDQNWWLIEDDYDNEFVYQGRVDVPLTQTAKMHGAAAQRIFFMGSFSKVLFRGLRLGFIVAPLKHVAQLHTSQKALGFSVSLPMQPGVADFMQHGGFDRHINRMRRHYRLKRDALLALLKTHLSPWFHWQKPSGGMHILIEINNEMLSLKDNKRSDDIIAKDLLANNVQLSTLSSHYVEGGLRQGFILGFSGASIEDMQYLVNVVKKWFLHHNL